MPTGSTPACTALKQDGTPCNKTVGTVPTSDGPRCWSHQKRDQRRGDPGSRCPVKRPRTPEDIQRIMDWALVRAAEGKMSAPQVNALSSMAKTWLRVYRDTLTVHFAAYQDAVEAVLELLAHAIAKPGSEK